jgi:hypothetical protein
MTQLPAKDRYIDLLKKMLTDFHRMEYGEYKPLYKNDPSFKRRIMLFADTWVRALFAWRGGRQYAICEKIDFKEEWRKFA